MIPLSPSPQADRKIWKFTKNGYFLVKSAYHCAVARFSTMNANNPSSSVVPKGWKKIWKIRAVPRVRVFTWRAWVNALPTRANLVRRGGIADPICGLCGEEIETTEHILLHCTRVQPVWYGCMAMIQSIQFQHISFKDFLWYCMDNYPPEYLYGMGDMAT